MTKGGPPHAMVDNHNDSFITPETEGLYLQYNADTMLNGDDQSIQNYLNIQFKFTRHM